MIDSDNSIIIVIIDDAFKKSALAANHKAIYPRNILQTVVFDKEKHEEGIPDSSKKSSQNRQNVQDYVDASLSKLTIYKYVHFVQ